MSRSQAAIVRPAVDPWEALLRPFTDTAVKAIDATGEFASKAFRAYGALLEGPQFARMAATGYARMAAQVAKDATALARDLLLILAAGFIAGVICKRLGVSLLVGYLVAGAVLGEGVLGLLGSESHEFENLAHIGALLLLFAIGLGVAGVAAGGGCSSDENSAGSATTQTPGATSGGPAPLISCS